MGVKLWPSSAWGDWQRDQGGSHGRGLTARKAPGPPVSAPRGDRSWDAGGGRAGVTLRARSPPPLPLWTRRRSRAFRAGRERPAAPLTVAHAGGGQPASPAGEGRSAVRAGRRRRAIMMAGGDGGRWWRAMPRSPSAGRRRALGGTGLLRAAPRPSRWHSQRTLPPRGGTRPSAAAAAAAAALRGPGPRSVPAAGWGAGEPTCLFPRPVRRGTAVGSLTRTSDFLQGVRVQPPGSRRRCRRAGLLGSRSPTAPPWLCSPLWPAWLGRCEVGRLKGGRRHPGWISPGCFAALSAGEGEQAWNAHPSAENGRGAAAASRVAEEEAEERRWGWPEFQSSKSSW